jgi:hypothetical protein
LLPPVLLFLFTVLPNEHFGQREHVMFVASAPYLIASMARAEGVPLVRASSLAIGWSPGVFLAMKPYYLAIPAAVELFLLTRARLARAFTDLIPWAIFAVALPHLVLMYTVFGTSAASSCRWRSNPTSRSATPAGARC